MGQKSSPSGKDIGACQGSQEADGGDGGKRVANEVPLQWQAPAQAALGVARCGGGGDGRRKPLSLLPQLPGPLTAV